MSNGLEMNPNWGFNPAGTPLGGTSSLSMPGQRTLESFGDPAEQARNLRSGFASQVQRRYGKVNPWNAGLWDPRGREALTNQPSDYYEGMSDVNAAVKDFDAETSRILEGGSPIVGTARPRTNVNFQLLYGKSSGLSPENADALGKALQSYDPGIVEGISVPNNFEETQWVDEQSGIVLNESRVNPMYLDRQGGINPAVRAVQAARSSLPVSRPIERVDENGIVFNKYTPGAGPYDSPSRTRPGGIAGAVRGTRLASDGANIVAPGTARNARLSPSYARTTSAIASMGDVSHDANGNNVSNGYSSGGGTNYQPSSVMQTQSASQARVVYSDEVSGVTEGEPKEGYNAGQVAGIAGLVLLGVVGLGMIVKGASNMGKR